MFPNISYELLKIITKFIVFKNIFANKLNKNITDLEISYLVDSLKREEEYSFNNIDDSQFNKTIFLLVKELKSVSDLAFFSCFKNKFIRFLQEQIVNDFDNDLNQNELDYINRKLIKIGFDPFFEIIELSTGNVLLEKFKSSDMYSKIKSSVSYILIIIDDLYTSISLGKNNKSNNILNIKISRDGLSFEDSMNYFITQHNLEIDKFNSYENEIKYRYEL